MAGRKTGEKLRKCTQIFLTYLFSHVGLCGLVVAYSVMGAFIFEYLEAERELEQRKQIQTFREKLMKDLWQLTDNTTAIELDNWTWNASQLLREFETQVVTAAKLEGYDGKETDNQERQWSFSGALLYSITVITTIGYGNLAPKTAAGKMVTMIYALIGIPLMLLCLSNIGTLMAKTFQFAFAKLCCSLQCCQYRSHYKSGCSAAHPVQIGPVTSEPVPVVRERFSHIVKTKLKKTSSKCNCVVPIAVADRDLPNFDYDILTSVVSDAPKHVDRGDEKGNLETCRLYGLDRLSMEAKLVLAECAQYSLAHDGNIDQNSYHSTVQLVERLGNRSPTSVALSATHIDVGLPIIGYCGPKCQGNIFPLVVSEDELAAKVDGHSSVQLVRKRSVPASPVQVFSRCSPGESKRASVDGSDGTTVPIGWHDSPVGCGHAGPNLNSDKFILEGPSLGNGKDYSGGAAVSCRRPRCSQVNDSVNHQKKIADEFTATIKSSPLTGRLVDKGRVPVMIVLAFLVGYICVGAVVFSTWEEWTFLDGAYFSFITLSTIGFGDLVPGSNVLSTETHEGQAKLVICCLYLVLGLAIIAMSFNLVQEEVVTRFQKLGRYLGILDEK